MLWTCFCLVFNIQILTFCKMAAGKDDCLQSVREFLDKEFGENLDELGDLRHVIERKQHYEDILKNEVFNATYILAENSKHSFEIIEIVFLCLK